MRNLAWKAFSEQASRTLDFRKYRYFGDIWVPATLAQGDIIRADLPTDYDRKGVYELCPRNCLVLGVDLDPETMNLAAIRVMRFSYSINEQGAQDIAIDPLDLRFRLRVSGLRQEAVLRTGRVEILAPDSAHFGFAIDRIGAVGPSLFPLIRQGVRNGFAAFRSRHGFEKPDSGKTLFVSGLDPDRWAETDAFGLQEVEAQHDQGQIENFAQCGGDRRLEWVSRMKEALPGHILDSQYQRYVEIRQARTLSREENEAMRANAKVRRLLSFSRRLPHREMAGLVELATRPFDEDRVDLGAFDIDTQKATLASIPDLRQLLEKKFGLAGQEDGKSLSVKFFHQAIDPTSLRDLETLGIGGLMREPRIQLPKQLWRGRYLMMRVPSLAHPDEMAESVWRPCAAWKAYARKDEDGNPVLAGLELHPCTRGAAHLYSHKMKVRPMDTTVPVPSYLIADLQIRAPISAEYFQPLQPGDGTFYQLLPHMVEQFEEKRYLAGDAQGDIRTYGLQTVPDDWVEVALPDPPGERLRQYLGRSHLKFVGQKSAQPG